MPKSAQPSEIFSVQEEVPIELPGWIQRKGYIYEEHMMTSWENNINTKPQTKCKMRSLGAKERVGKTGKQWITDTSSEGSWKAIIIIVVIIIIFFFSGIIITIIIMITYLYSSKSSRHYSYYNLQMCTNGNGSNTDNLSRSGSLWCIYWLYSISL